MKSLFTDEFPTVTSKEELNDLKAQYPNYDSYYLASGSIAERKQKFDALYVKFEPYADSHFLQEIKINFHQRSWEMYLACVLLENGFTIISSDKGPDIKIILEGKTIWIECVAPTQGEGDDRVPDIFYGGVQNVPEEEMILRLSSSLKEKFEKYQEYLEKEIIGKNDIFIIAINRGAFGHPDAINPLIFNCLFSLGYLTLPIRVDSNAGESYYSRRKELKKKSGGIVPMDFFEDQQHIGISAVIYSKENVLNHPQKLGNDCILVHNPMAINRLSEKVFPFFIQHRAIINNQGMEIQKIKME